MKDNLIYIQKSDGTFVKVGDAKGNPNNANFIILYGGKDWSGFRTLINCEKQLMEIASRKRFQDFTVVER